MERIKLFLYLLISFSVINMVKNQDSECGTEIECYAKAIGYINEDRSEIKRQLDTFKTLYDDLKAKNAEIDKKTDSSKKIPEFFETYFPIGSTYVTFANKNPPLHGTGSIRWQALPEGYTAMTANTSNTGTTSGSQRLDNGVVENTVLTIDQMAAHNHAQGSGVEFPTQGYEGTTSWRDSNKNDGRGRFAKTFNRGGSKPHNHGLNALNQKLIFWKRVS